LFYVDKNYFLDFYKLRNNDDCIYHSGQWYK